MKSKYFIVLMIFLLTIITSCKANGTWDYKAGFVVAKERGRVLVVREEPAIFKQFNEKPFTPSQPFAGVVRIDEILKDAAPDALWLTGNRRH